MTIPSTRSMGLPENGVGSTIDTDVIKPSSGGSTEASRDQAADVQTMTQANISLPFSRLNNHERRRWFGSSGARVRRAAIRAQRPASADLPAPSAPSPPSP